ncbi:LOW QUALITY PROTEIN: hypothetical protein KUTeg_019236 [Tegillarca granosa]|uniref:Uncharacterized protein n=1 Tax=Tegillarca granosa TaxID=220873 RepID=A0ABQ9ECE2_TEGGR|nr:LOW QUALITY PROTEIN: hypothetical protein KUTeg_019236 [Tegillarca granosa]
MCREALDDYRRYRRDKEANSQKFKKLTRDGMVQIPSSDIKVGDLIVVEKVLFKFISVFRDSLSMIISDEMVEINTYYYCLMFYCSLKFKSVSISSAFKSLRDILDIKAHVFAEAPQKDIHSFIGTFKRTDSEPVEDSLSVDNTLWSNTVVASGTALGVVIYTGSETRNYYHS